MIALIHDVIHHTSHKARSITWLTEKLQCSERELRACIRVGKEQGYLVHLVNQEVFTKLAIGAGPLVTIGKASPGRHKIAHVTDTHAGSTHFAKKPLRKFLSFAWKEGCRSMGFTGDGTDGVKALLLPEQRLHGADEQIDELVETMSEYPWNVAAISGNHDGYSSNAVGLDMGKIIEDRARKAGLNWQHAGTCRGNAIIEGARTHLFHPMGAASTPNTIRSMLNRHAENLKDATDLILSGHLHHYCHVHVYPEDIFATSGGCFQLKKGEFANRISRPWDIGGTIVSFSVDKKGRAGEFSSRFYPMVQG